ncbi:hypothetical protein AKJ09_08523 [Labilithrix luteola]|uniref:Uncharacterized protein n=1 Tax=Labilithrix luteola TaxID=1391654 RepID=A0A0K1Q8X1_9BACT|nr:hypothetical protein AKJ09_08523 [Labilithrix luteola]
MPSVPPPPRAIAQPEARGAKTRVLVHAGARAVAVDADNLYYGDTEQDAVFAVPKAGGEPRRLARRAPVAGTFALDQDELAWVATPGDVVLRVNVKTEASSTLHDKGIFSDVAADRGEFFITEVFGAGGAILRATKGTTTKIATLDASPRALVVSGDQLFVTTPQKLLRATRTRGDVETIATGTGFDSPQAAGDFVYVVATEPDGTGRRIARIPKAGGTLTPLVRDVRDAPMEVAGDEILYFAAGRPQLRAMALAGGSSRIVAEDEAFSYAAALASDASTVYVATGAGEDGVILAVPRK